MTLNLEAIRERHAQAILVNFSCARWPGSSADIQGQALDDIPALCDCIEELEQWVNDLQSGMHINCVYCGHRYGPGDNPDLNMRQTLEAHIAKCPRHPLSEALARIEELERERDELKVEVEMFRERNRMAESWNI
jgi:hypothetical protein